MTLQLCIFLLLISSNTKIAAKTIIKNNALNMYFSALFLKEDFGYTLIGARALAIDWRFTPTPFKTESQKIIFDSKNFLFKECKTDSSCRLVFFIHKHTFIQTFNKNKKIFRQILGTHITAKNLLQEIILSENHILYILHFDYALLGILLGYGKENALLFKRWMELTPLLKLPSKFLSYPTPMQPNLRWQRIKIFKLQRVEPSPGFQSIQEEYQWLQNNFNSGAYEPEEFRVIDLVSPLGFKVRKSTETERLICKYTRCKRILAELFYNRTVLDVVFVQLTAEQPFLISSEL